MHKKALVLPSWHACGESKAEKTSHFRRRFSVLALPIFPASHPASIVGANELNFCVRDGNRWTLAAINTNFVDTSFISFSSPQAAKLTHSAVSPLRTKSASLGFCSVYLYSGIPENITIILRFFHLSSAFFFTANDPAQRS